MAIKVSSDTVINDSKQLQNIASLDSTTTTNFIAANLGIVGGSTPPTTATVTTATILTGASNGTIYFIKQTGAGGLGNIVGIATVSSADSYVIETGSDRGAQSGYIPANYCFGFLASGDTLTRGSSVTSVVVNYWNV